MKSLQNSSISLIFEKFMYSNERFFVTEIII